MCRRYVRQWAGTRRKQQQQQRIKLPPFLKTSYSGMLKIRHAFV
jgi:hypothetical protein